VTATQGLFEFHYVYKITDKDNKLYIGETRLDLELRHRLHKSEPCKCAAKELDLESSKIELLCICFRHEATKLEQLFIEQHPECVNYNKRQQAPSFVKSQLKRIQQHKYRNSNEGKKDEINLQVFTSRLFSKDL
jgi:predicted GIY-YIG superfamily endonuclease